MSAPTVQVRDWHVGQALASFERLTEVLLGLTEAEVLKALELESQSRRRRSIMDRLIGRAVRLNEVAYSTQLKEKYHGTSTK
jgi:hypothetical protein